MNIKKLFPQKRLSKKELIEFLDKKGFYIILVLCIAVVGATAIFVTTYNITSNSNYDADKLIPDESAKSPLLTDELPGRQSSIDTSADGKDNQIALNDQGSAAGTAKTSTSDTGKQNTAQTDDKAVAAAASQSKSNTQTAKQNFVMPVLGDTILEFTSDNLVYSKTLEEWRAHSGIDIAADRGTSVKAVMDGVVAEIKKDPRFGITVIVNHNGGLKTVYSNLASDNMVYPNQIVKQGEVIGSVGNTALFESVEQSHLHFEVLKNSEPVNPATYLQMTGAAASKQ